MSRLLILSCSKSKLPTPGLLPAFERYNGPLFKILRMYQKRTGENLDVWIISAKFGLIPGSTPIPDYDQVMTRARAFQISDQIKEAMKIMFDDHNEAFFVGGENYLMTMMLCRSSIPKNITITIAHGGLYKKNALLKEWLWRGQ